MTYWPRLAAGGETRNTHGNFAFALIAPLLPFILFRYVGRMRRSVVSLSCCGLMPVRDRFPEHNSHNFTNYPPAHMYYQHTEFKTKTGTYLGKAEADQKRFAKPRHYRHCRPPTGPLTFKTASVSAYVLHVHVKLYMCMLYRLLTLGTLLHQPIGQKTPSLERIVFSCLFVTKVPVIAYG